MYMRGLESNRKVFFFALAILVAWKYVNFWPSELCFVYKGFYVQKDATVEIQVLRYIPLHRVELSPSNELLPSTPNLL